MPVSLAEDAPAKVNLTLRVLGRRSDGFHEIESLVAFADVGDRLSFSPGGELTLVVRGPNASAALSTRLAAVSPGSAAARPTRRRGSGFSRAAA